MVSWLAKLTSLRSHAGSYKQCYMHARSLKCPPQMIADLSTELRIKEYITDLIPRESLMKEEIYVCGFKVSHPWRPLCVWVGCLCNVAHSKASISLYSTAGVISFDRSKNIRFPLVAVCNFFVFPLRSFFHVDRVTQIPECSVQAIPKCRSENDKINPPVVSRCPKYTKKTKHNGFRRFSSSLSSVLEFFP